MAEKLNVPYVGDVPLVSKVVENGDSGTPIVMADSDSPASKAYRELAGQVAAQLSINQAKEDKVETTFEIAWKG